MSQFTETQLATIKSAVAFLAETQQANHGHVADDVQEVLSVLNPVAEVAAVEEQAAVQAFIDDVPHEEFTHEDDKAEDTEE